VKVAQYPAAAHALQRKRKDMRREESSRRDSMKVAQYEVLGWRSKERPVPDADGTIDQCWQSLSRVRNQKPSLSIVPTGRTCLFASFLSPAAAGYWATFAESLRDKSPHALP